ncbi:hypothetical protein DFJ77DRAFT_62848 [Powellomyces hirtus]|nr:hypothetical protein DFJ77DRAFT_62848 [Powellomyces hirtus]
MSSERSFLLNRVSGMATGSLSELGGLLATQLETGDLECLVCLCGVKPDEKIWSCDTCFKVFHLSCMQQWARGNTTEGTFRCPGCQCPTRKSVQEYRCFCGKQVDPPLRKHDIPHSCEQLCRRKPCVGAGYHCRHACAAPCHPGPCAKCPKLSETRTCFCSREKYKKRCGEVDFGMSCGKQCAKTLACGFHGCTAICHEGPCAPCTVEKMQLCFCGKSSGLRLCGSGTRVSVASDGRKVEMFACEEPCGKNLGCENHKCQLSCHEGPCPPCSMAPENLTMCCCGGTPLKSLRITRTSCLDPVPTCSQTCRKLLNCGVHRCDRHCHEGVCRQCTSFVQLDCACASKKETLPCNEIMSELQRAGRGDEKVTSWTPTCTSLCDTLRTCGKHRCSKRCCPLKGVEKEHECPLVCGKSLQCGKHTCMAPCHKGYCPPCLEAVFEEVSCSCGMTRLYPPIPCGTNLSVVCPKDCPYERRSECGHSTSDHRCHSGLCPPCPHLVNKSCYGGHLARDVSCGSPGKSFSCGLPCSVTCTDCGHPCTETCHAGPCQPRCGGPCRKDIIGCTIGHKCAEVCGHDPKVRDCGNRSACTVSIQVTCACGAFNGREMKCKDFDKFGFAPVRDVGLARRIKVACSTRSNNECAVNRWKTRARAALMTPHRDANAAGPANLTSAMQGGDALWFHSCPNNLGKRDITSFIGHFIPRSNELQFVQPGRAARASLPAHIGTSFPGAREYFVRFRTEVDSKVLQALLRGREEFVSALRSTDLLGPEDVIMSTVAIEARPTRTMPVSVEVPPEQPNPVPTNAYELLPAIEDETPSTIAGDVEKKEPGTTEPKEKEKERNRRETGGGGGSSSGED